MPFYQGGVGQAWPPSRIPPAPSPWVQAKSGPPGLLSDELWPTVQLASVGVGPVPRRAPRRDPVPTHTPTDDEPNSIPLSVVNLYRERLDEKALNFLRHGPRSFEEQLAYAQQVDPTAYRNASPASDEAQQRFGQWRDVDWGTSFVGPDGIVYLRHPLGEEKPAARIRRYYESSVGGYVGPSLDQLLGQLGFPDPSARLTPEAKAKLAELPPDHRPYSATDTAWRTFAHEQRVNPDTWRYGKAVPEDDQRDYWFGTGRDLAPSYSNGYFVGPDGVLYRQNALTRPDKATQFSDAFRHKLAEEELRDNPPDPWDLFWNGLQNTGPGFFAGIVRYGSRGGPQTQDDLEAVLNKVRSRNKGTLEHIAGSRNQQGNDEKEEYIPGPFGGRSGSVRPDATLRASSGDHVRIEQQDVDMRTGKVSNREWLKQLWEFLSTHSQGYDGVPRSNVLGILKRHQLEEFLRKRDRQDDDDNPR
jgi:hypothetical protein